MLMIKNLASVLALALAVAGCGDWTPPPGMTSMEAQKAQYECNRENNPFLAHNSAGGNIFIGAMGMTECMRAHGFSR